ncbi:MAG: polysaccharide deacetylase family protein, partial [Lachnospiraceae bacterium]|nr:polysaccharide deacetylase family protein [Lachnospiraceae bacterium]
LADYVENGTMLPEKPVLLTLDDGYENNYTNAFPLLKKYNMKAVISLIGKDMRLNENQLKEKHDSGLVEIGNHTYDLHSISGDVKDADKKPGETQQCH